MKPTTDCHILRTECIVLLLRILDMISYDTLQIILIYMMSNTIYLNTFCSDTGDLARINPATGDIIITGRAKDTIVLSNGENVEPQPIEDAMVGMSALVDQAMLVGQDQNYLSALLVVNAAELAKRGKCN